MRRALIIALAAGLVAGSLAGPAVAQKKKKKPKKPAAVELFLHGRGPVTEAYMHETWLDSNWMSMDNKKPTAAQPSSMFVTNYVGGPNTNCDGNGLLPVWKGDFAGKFKGNVTVKLHTIATPAASMNVALYADPTGTCSSAATGSEAPPPVATEAVAVPSGPGVTEVTFKGVSFASIGSLALQLHMVGPSPAQVRVLFDGASHPSSVMLAP